MKKIRERSLRLENLEDRMLLAVTAGGAETAAAAAYAPADPLPTAATQLATPTGLDAACTANNTLNVTWNAVPNASSYTVYYKTTTATAWRSSTASTNSVTLRGLVATNAYNIKVVAIGDGVNYTNSEESATITRIPSTGVSTVVTTLDDIQAVASPSGPISFRQAVYFAQRTGMNVTFDASLNGTIDLATYGQIELLSSAMSFSIDGDNRITLTNSGTRGTDRLFTVRESASGYDVNMSNLTLTGFSVTNDTDYYTRGGAIFVWNTAFGAEGDPRIEFNLDHCTVTGCSSATSGGFFYAYGGALNATNCTFTGNTANEGGVVYTLAGDVHLTDSVFSGNTAIGTGDSSSLGGALVLNTYYASTIDNCVFSNNAAKIQGLFSSGADASGGAIALINNTKKEQSTDLIIVDTQIIDNAATCADGQDYCRTVMGGAVYAQNAGARFYNCKITGNAAELGLNCYGGAIYTVGTYGNVSSGQLFFFMTDISDNYIGYKDGDIWGSGGAAGCVARGGAIHSEGVFHLVNCTVTDNAIYASKCFSNSYSKIGSAIFSYSNSVFYDTTIAGNKVVDQSEVGYKDDYAALVIYGGTTIKTSTILGNYYIDTINNTRIENDIYSHAWMLVSPSTRLESCAYNPAAIGKDSGTEGADAWEFDFSDSCVQVTDYAAYFNDYAAGDYTLSENSPGIDAVNMDEWVDFGYTYDIRYYLDGQECYRTVNGINDIGAYEYQSTQTFEVTIVDYEGSYDGEAHSVAVEDLQAGDVVYYSADGVNYSTSVISYTDPGTYTTYVKVERAGYEDFTGTGTVTITAAATKIEVAVVVSASAAPATEVDVLPNSISTATVGDTLYAQVWILNADESTAGCTGGYIDLNYTTGSLAKGSYTVSSIYASQADYVNDSTAGLVACFGGCSQAGVNDLAVDQWALLGTYTFTASVEGVAEVAAALPTLNGTHIKGLNLSRAGAGNFADNEILFGSASFTVEASGGEQLAAPTITTGTRGIYVSYGANRHNIQWGAVANASGYEVQYSTDGGSTWSRTVSASGLSAVITGLTYGADVTYRVRALGTGSYTDSDWSRTKTFNVCPMDINGDGDIAGSDRTIMATSWLAEEGEEGYQYYADINGDGEVSNTDRPFIGQNWNKEAGDDDLVYPRALRAADAAFAGYEAGDLDVDIDVF
ncbi:MAG: fibronectin type III domain-containing protein [Thermoguttaceae bacterium]|nr:fibronectin type III domain-containing protein [Thermoguttaceae bacterium]